LTESFPFAFAQPGWLALLALVPVFFLLRGRHALRGGVRLGSLHLLGPLLKQARQRPWAARWLWLPPVFALGAVALARPQRVSRETEREFSGIEIMLALDVSRSMTALDFQMGGRQVDRLVAARRVCKEFIDLRSNDRIGAVAFAGQPYPVSVPTLSHDWVKANIDRADIGLVPDGTAIGSAIAAAASRLDKQGGKTKIIVLITDGKNNVGQLDPLDAARQAAALGIRIYTIAVGRSGSSMIRVPNEFGGESWARLVNEYDPETLKRIADLTGGAFYRADAAQSLRDAFASIDKLEKSKLQSHVTVRRDDLYAWILIPAALLAVVELFHPTREERAFPATPAA